MSTPSPALLKLAIDEHTSVVRPRLERLWNYYRNSLRAVPTARSGRWYRLAQEQGLPSRITSSAPNADDRVPRREIVVENDIAWRLHAMVDFMFGKPIKLRSTASDDALRARIETALDAVWEASGGIALLQDLALLAHVYGHIDLVLRASTTLSQSDLASLRTSDALRVELIEPRRGIPILDPNDYRRILAYAIHVEQHLHEIDHAASIQALLQRAKNWWSDNGHDAPAPAPKRRTATFTELLTAESTHLYQDGKLIEERDNPIARLPVVHIQNTAQPFLYEGLGEVEPLIPLQDELNTRLSDRANRVTLQSFKMYLAKGIEGFEKMPVGPGMIFSTDNMDAQITPFGGDSSNPSEEAHIQEVREAMDKISGVPPLASGVVRAKIGNLTSANALRITLMGLLSKTARKRVTYGRGIAEMSRLVLAALHDADILKTEDADRGVRIEWPDPLPTDARELVETVRAKAQLGVPKDDLLIELGHAAVDPGLT
jgi:hypothetical protein